MPYTILKLADEPIVIVHIVGSLSTDTHYQMTIEIADLIEKVPGRIYRINDMTKADIKLLSAVKLVDQGLKGWPGTISDMRIISLMVVRDGNAFLSIKHVMQNPGISGRVYAFMELTDALAFARAQISGQAHAEPVEIS